MFFEKDFSPMFAPQAEQPPLTTIQTHTTRGFGFICLRFLQVKSRKNQTAGAVGWRVWPVELLLRCDLQLLQLLQQHRLLLHLLQLTHTHPHTHAS